MTTCFACAAELTGDSFKGEPPTYQFDNALWLALFGGYGMFVDNLEAKLPINTDDRWLRDDDGEYLTIDHNGQVHPIDNPQWVPEFREQRTIDGADYEAVICHECAHALFDAVPWLKRLIDPHNSHAHRTAWKDAHPDHYGWDYDTERAT